MRRLDKPIIKFYTIDGTYTYKLLRDFSSDSEPIYTFYSDMLELMRKYNLSQYQVVELLLPHK